jgi:hypothetical protein
LRGVPDLRAAPRHHRRQSKRQFPGSIRTRSGAWQALEATATDPASPPEGLPLAHEDHAGDRDPLAKHRKDLYKADLRNIL